MFYQQAKHVGYRRYEDIVAVFDYLSGKLILLGEPAASLWEKMKSPLSLSEATHFVSQRANFPVRSQLIESALSKQIEKGFLLTGESKHHLQQKYHKVVRNRGINTDKLYRGFINTIKGNVSTTQLVAADIEVNNACNLRCVHCYIADYTDRDVMTLTEINCLLDQLANAGVLFLELTGGELTLRKEFLDIIRSAREHHFVVTILTNATQLNDYQIEELGAIGPTNVSVSLYGVTAEVHEQVTQQSGTYDITLNTIRRLREAGVSVVLRYLVMRHNVHQLKELPAFADALDCLFSTSYTLFAVFGSLEQVHRNRVSDEDLIWLFRNGLLNPPRRSQCIAGTHRLRISSNGDVFPCGLLRLKFGNLRESTVEEIVASPQNNRQLAAIHAVPAVCSACPKYDSCPRCPGLALHEDGNLASSSTAACHVTDLYQIVNPKAHTDQNKSEEDNGQCSDQVR